MDYRNASIPIDKVTSFDVNKAIQRSLTKAAARHGLGLYIYAGEDLPEENTVVVVQGTASGEKILVGKPECPEDVWHKLVKAEVQGKKTKEGLSPLQYLAKNYHTDQLVLTQFNQEVQMFRDAMEANSNTK